jgi:hypothetical protein
MLFVLHEIRHIFAQEEELGGIQRQLLGPVGGEREGKRSDGGGVLRCGRPEDVLFGADDVLFEALVIRCILFNTNENKP